MELKLIFKSPDLAAAFLTEKAGMEVEIDGGDNIPCRIFAVSSQVDLEGGGTRNTVVIVSKAATPIYTAKPMQTSLKLVKGRNKPMSTEQEVLEYCQTHEVITMAAVKEALPHLKYSTTCRAIKDLADAGKLQKLDKSTYKSKIKAA